MHNLKMQEQNPKVSIIIVNFNNRDFLPPLLESIHRSKYKNLEIIIVDCASRDGSVEFIRQHYPDVKLFTFKKDPGFSGALHYGAKKASGDFILFLNTDIVLPPDLLNNMVKEMKTSGDYVVIAPIQIGWKGKAINRGVTIPWFSKKIFAIIKPFLQKRPYGTPMYQNIACTMVSRKLYLRCPVNPYFRIYEDVEWGLRLHLFGIKLKVLESQFVLHKIGGTFKLGTSKHAFIIGRNFIAWHFSIFKFRTLFLLSPLMIYFVFYYLAYFTYKRNSKIIAYLSGILDFFKNLKKWAKFRSYIQKNRKITDFELLKIIGSSYIFSYVNFKKLKKIYEKRWEKEVNRLIQKYKLDRFP